MSSKSLHLANNYRKLLALSLSVLVVISLGFYLPLWIDQFNDNVFGQVTILENPKLVKALQDTQAEGVAMCIHGWNHEDWSAYNKAEAEETINKCLSVFEEANLTAVAFLLPYISNQMLPPSASAGIASANISMSLPNLSGGGWGGMGQYGDWWRNMTSFDDSRYEEEYDRIMSERPATCLLHAIEWNQFLKQLVCDYLEHTNRSKVTIRVDDVEVNTPAQVVYDMAGSLLKYKNGTLGLLAYGVIPSGTWRGGDPVILGVSVNTMMKAYWIFFLLTAFFPLSFFTFWRFMPNHKKGTNSKGDPPADNPGNKRRYSVSVIVPAYNEEENVAGSIEAILKQDYNGDLEVIFVNDGSTDRTGEIAAKYPVKLINLTENTGKFNALNMGIRHSKNEILVFSDSDSQMSNGALSALVRYLDNHDDVQGVAGNVFINNVHSKNLLRHFQAIEYCTEQEISRYLQGISGNVLVCPGPLFAVRRLVVEKIMFEDKTVIEDADFTVNMLESSFKVGREAEAKVYTNAPTSLKRWVTQRKRWWYGNLQIWKTHKKWAKRNLWAILNYFGFVNSLFSLILMSMLPFLLFTYDNILLVLLRGMAYTFTPIVLYTVYSAFLFREEKKLVALIPIYSLVYATLKVLVVTYLYLIYITGRGIKVTFGSRTIRVK